jgi:hypothetical protein
MFLCQMFEATGWKLEEPEVADQEKYDLIVPTIVKSPAGCGHDEEVSRAVAMETLLLCWRCNVPSTHTQCDLCNTQCMLHHSCHRSTQSLVQRPRIAQWLRAGGLGFGSRQGKENFLCSTASRQALRPT